MICQRCKKENPEDVKFCIHCGAPIQEEESLPPVFHGEAPQVLNDDWSKEEPVNPKVKEPVIEEQPAMQPTSKPSSHTGLFVALGILIGLLVVGGIGFGGYMIFNTNQKMEAHEEKIAQLEEEKEKQQEELEKEREAREEAEDKADQAQEEADAAKERSQKEERSDSSDYQYGFELGWYRANYDMVLRSSGDYGANKVGSLKKGASIRIIQVVKGVSNSYWGQSQEGSWVCLQDPDFSYLAKE